MFFYTNNTLGIKLNANSTVSFPEYAAGYLKTDASGNITADSATPGTGSFLPLAGGTMTGNIRLNDNVQLQIGSSNDAYITHSGTKTVFVNGVGDLEFTNDAEDGDIIFESDDGSNGTTQYFRLDGGSVTTQFLKTVKLYDAAQLWIGDSNDLQIYHDGSNNYIKSSTGDLYIQQYADNKDIRFQSDNGSGGLTTYLTIDGLNENITFSKPASFLDGVKAKFGNSSDLQIYHDGTNSYIDETGTGSLYIKSAGAIRLQSDTGENMIYAQNDAAVNLYHNNVKKFETQVNGITVSGAVIAANGDKGNPSYSFTSDTNTGMFSDTADVLEFAVGGDTNLQIRSGYLDIQQYVRHISDTDTFFGFNAANSFVVEAGGNENLKVQGNGVTLSYADDARLNTQSGGVQVIGDLSLTTGTVNIPSYIEHVGDTNTFFGFSGNDTISFTTANVQRMRITSTGTVAIGNNSNYASLNVITSDAGNGNTGQGLVWLQNTNTATSGGSMTMAVQNDYGVGFGNYIKFLKVGASTIGQIYANSGRTNVVYSTSSDYRLKEDLKSFNAVDIINQIPVYDFKWKVGDFRDYGVMAHEMQAVLPGLVMGEKDGEQDQAVDYPAMVPILMQAIKELKAEIEILKSK